MTDRILVEPAQSPLARIFAAGPAARALTRPCRGHRAPLILDPQRDLASIARAAASVGARVLVLDDVPGPSAAYDPLAPRGAQSDHPAATIEKESP